MASDRPKMVEIVEPSAVECEMSIEPVLFRRNAAGRWSADATVRMNVKLPDGRVLIQTRPITIGGILQAGRRPLPKEAAD